MRAVAVCDRAGTVAPVPRERLRWSRTTGQRVVLGVNVFLVVLLGGGALVIGYAAQKLAAVERLDVARDLTPPPLVGPVTAGQVVASDPPETTPGQTTTSARFVNPAPNIEENYLIVGSDNADRIAEGDQVLSGREAERSNNLADTIMLLRLRPAEGTASLLSIPRDLEVTIAGTTRTAKINTAFNHPDAETRVTRLIDTIEENFDIGLQHYIEVDLEGFRRLVDSIGGVAVCFSGPSRDTQVGFAVDSGGWAELAGPEALNYVRSRELEIQAIDGTWDNASPQADLDRINRQQAFVRSTVSQTLSDVLTDPRLLLSLLNIAAEELVVSNTFNIVGDGSDLAGWFRNFDDEDLVTASLDVEFLRITAARDNQSRVGMTEAAEVQLDVFRGIRPDDVVPKRVSVELVGSDQQSLAVSEGLAEIGFGIVSRSMGVPAGSATVVRYGLGGDGAATLVAAYLDGDVEFSTSDSLAPGTVLVEIGSDDVVVLSSPRVLEAAAPAIVTTIPTLSPGTESTTSTTEQRYEYDCSLPQPTG